VPVVAALGCNQSQTPNVISRCIKRTNDGQADARKHAHLDLLALAEHEADGLAAEVPVVRALGHDAQLLARVGDQVKRLAAEAEARGPVHVLEPRDLGRAVRRRLQPSAQSGSPTA
jgi:hypothetical protein